MSHDLSYHHFIIILVFTPQNPGCCCLKTPFFVGQKRPPSGSLQSVASSKVVVTNRIRLESGDFSFLGKHKLSFCFKYSSHSSAMVVLLLLLLLLLLLFFPEIIKLVNTTPITMMFFMGDIRLHGVQQTVQQVQQTFHHRTIRTSVAEFAACSKTAFGCFLMSITMVFFCVYI